MRRVTTAGDVRHGVVDERAAGCVEIMSQSVAVPGIMPTRKLLLVGQPNVGKSLIFNRLTQRYATVSNYPGTTVEITSALAEVHGELREVVDTPGTNTLAPTNQG